MTKKKAKTMSRKLAKVQTKATIKKKSRTSKMGTAKSSKKGASKKGGSFLFESLLELIRRTSAEIPDDVQKVILEALEREEKNTTAEYAMTIIKANIELAKKKSQPLCQDTGTVLVYVSHPQNFDQLGFSETFKKAITAATKKGYLRQNSVNSVTGKSEPTNLGPGHPVIHFHQHKKNHVEVKLMLKGGGCENVGAQYSLPYAPIEAGRDMDGVRKVILDAVVKAQGQGCGPGVLGICIGGDRGSGYVESKEQLLRKLHDKNPDPVLAAMEADIVATCNKLGIGPMGFGGKTTLLGCKVSYQHRVPASFFVSISYMCWAFRRQGISLGSNNSIKNWLY